MLQGIHLTLMIGPVLPVPAPKAVVDAVQSVQITNGKDKSGFQISFAVGKTSPLLTTMLPAGFFDPMSTRVVIAVTLGGMPHVLMDGIVTRQDLAPSSEPGQSTLTITGEDLSVLMDVVEMPFMRYPAMPSIARVYAILAKYAAFGIVPLAIPPFIDDVPIPTKEVPTHKGTDLQYLKTLADECGYVFYVEPGPLPGQSIAYWGPDIRIPVPQRALGVNMDAHTNVESLNFSLDGLAKKVVVVTIFDPVKNRVPIVVPVPNINLFKPPLGARPTLPAKVEFPDYMTKEQMPSVINRVLGILARSSDAISVTGSLDVLRYGRVLRNRMLVGVRGGGLAYDGMYYVNSVTHNLKRGEFKQSFELSRDGLISNTPKVLV
ncbi:hypothetical protein [Ideonella sp.]|uniref:hypothetical protein n=1 Tax=Ideonella sp. TaxID=1929293 RepID=UPI002B4876EC|nr:hypothetical protein [Ideonella sp.]HJV68745.1 hypothetical protein [Ideonella sp.]